MNRKRKLKAVVLNSSLLGGVFFINVFDASINQIVRLLTTTQLPMLLLNLKKFGFQSLPLNPIMIIHVFDGICFK